ncbi:MAG: response regulator [Peptococcia bacterium]
MDKVEKIRVLIVDDNEDTRLNIRRMLSFSQDIIVVGDARDGLEAVQKSKELQPDIVLMDINMPKMDGLEAAEKITIGVPKCAVIVISVQGEQEYLRKAMMSGARSYLVKPFNSDELINTIQSVYQIEAKKQNQPAETIEETDKCEVVTVFGTKGGVGKTTIAVNLAVLLAKKKKKVAILDLDLQFGDVTIFLNLYPRRTISELVQEGALDLELVESNLTEHNSGVKILPAPSRPEYAELVTPAYVEDIIKLLKVDYDYIIIDTPPLFNEINLTALDLSNQVLLVLGMDLATIKNIKLSLELLASLNHREKIKLILNRASDDMGITVSDAEETLNFLVAAQIPSEGRIVVPALNEGIPFTISNPLGKASLALQKIADMVTADKGGQKALKAKRDKKIFGRLFK